MEMKVLCDIIAEVLNVDPKELSPNMTFTGDLGADSLDVYQIVLKLEDTFDIHLTNEKVTKVSTVEEAVALIKRERGN